MPIPQERLPAPEDENKEPDEDIVSPLTPQQITIEKLIFEKLFDDHEKGEGRVAEISWRVEAFLNSKLIDGEKIRQELKELAVIEDKEEFVNKILIILKPIYALNKQDPDKANELLKDNQILHEEKYQQQAEKKHTGKINDILYYDINEQVIEIHLAPARKLGFVKNFKGLIITGFNDLAKIVDENKNIKEITGLSWIIKEHPILIKKMGFTIEENHEVDASRAKASMSREDFLERYLEK